MGEVLRKLVELEIRRNPPDSPRLGRRLERAEKDLPGILLVVGALVGHPQHRHPLQPRDRLGDDVEMLARLQRHVHPRHAPDLAPPHSGAVHQGLAFQPPLLRAVVGGPLHRDRPAAAPLHAGHPDALADHRAHLPRPLGHGLRDVGGIPLSVERQPDPAGHAVGAQMRIALGHLRRTQLLDVDAEGPRHARLPREFLHPVFGERHVD